MLPGTIFSFSCMKLLQSSILYLKEFYPVFVGANVLINDRQLLILYIASSYSLFPVIKSFFSKKKCSCHQKSTN